MEHEAVDDLAKRIKAWQIGHPELMPGTVNSAYGLAEHLLAEGYEPPAERLCDPHRLLAMWEAHTPPEYRIGGQMRVRRARARAVLSTVMGLSMSARTSG